MDAKAKDYSPSNYKSFAVYRQTRKYVTSFSRGDCSSEVKKLQKFLNWAGFECGEADGSLGPATENAIIDFQKAVGLEPDGKFGSKSLKAAKEYSPKHDSESDVPKHVEKVYAGSFPTSTVSKEKGSKANVKRWQSFLKWYGYNIKIDGDFGTKTASITKKFQKANKLKSDGVVGKITIAKAKKIKK